MTEKSAVLESCVESRGAPLSSRRALWRRRFYMFLRKPGQLLDGVRLWSLRATVQHVGEEEIRVKEGDSRTWGTFVVVQTEEAWNGKDQEGGEAAKRS